MKTKLLSNLFLNLLLAFAASTTAQSQTEYRADAQTVMDTVSLQVTERLYLSPGTFAPTNTTIWFVADTAGDGVSTNPPANRILGSDDILVLRDVVDGRIFGSWPGRYNYLGLPVTNINSSNASIYVYLWNAQGTAYEPEQGASFGLYQVGIAPAPIPGNAKWLILSNVFANQFTVAAPDTTPQPPVIVVQPVSQTINAGETAMFSVQASGTPPLTYQWLKGGTDIVGATNSTLTLTNVSQADAGMYAARVSNSVTNVLSAEATLTVNAAAAPPSITAQPVSQTVQPGTNVTFTVEAAGAPPLTYQWRKNATDINAATNSSLTLTNVTVTDAGTYQVVVANSVTNVVSNEATLTVNTTNAPPTLGSLTFQVSGDSLVLEFSFTAASGVSYQVQSATNLAATPIQWSPEGGPIAGSGAAANVSLTNNVVNVPTKFFRVEAN